MPVLQHPHFGALDTSQLPSEFDVLWEGEQALATADDQAVALDLWADLDQALNPAQLDALAHSLSRLAELDALAREQLAIYLQNDPYFIEEHCGPDALAVYTNWAPQLAAMGGTATVPAFVHAMVLCRVGLYANASSEDDERIVMDYKVDRQSDQILAVKLHADGQFTQINWES